MANYSCPHSIAHYGMRSSLLMDEAPNHVNQQARFHASLRSASPCINSLSPCPGLVAQPMTTNCPLSLLRLHHVASPRASRGHQWLPSSGNLNPLVGSIADGRSIGVVVQLAILIDQSIFIRCLLVITSRSVTATVLMGYVQRPPSHA